MAGARLQPQGGYPVYPDFLSGTGYDGVRGPYAALGDRLCGVNCRHSFGPYLEGQPRAYSRNPDRDAGLGPGEAYQAAQRQRAIERRIRAAKRRIAAADGAGQDSSLERVRLGAAQREMREWVEGHPYLRRQRALERASELAAQPRGLGTGPELGRKAPGEGDGDPKPVNRHLYNAKVNYIERHGGVVVRNEETDAHLKAKGVNASNLGDVIFFGDVVTTSDLLEEAYHFQQHLDGAYADLESNEMLLRREIDAQRYLLSVTAQYKIPSSEVELTKKNLADYEERLRRLLEGRE